MLSISTFVVVILLFSTYHCNEEPSKPKPKVTTSLGHIVGYHKQSYEGKVASAFEGIPYAKPPTGDRRFKEPEPIEPWIGTWEAISLTECSQTNMGNPNKITGSEDCLHVNVYVPRDTINPEENLDVIVHIHGGAFGHGSGHSYAHPEYFMDRDVIFVTLNYRLGILGFLSTHDDVVPGNNGLKDQVLALKWVQKHIKSFGGNPNSVTLTGLSAGGVSVHYHYLSPLSKGLFHKGHSQSGVALNPWALQEEPLKKAKILAASVGCPDRSTKEMIDCLRQRPIRHILPKITLFYGFSFLPFTPFGPVLEHGGKNAFITKNPYYLLAKGEVQDLPWMVSTVSHEGIFPAAHLFRNLDALNSNWTDLAPFILDFNYTSAKAVFAEIATDIKSHYFGDSSVEISEGNVLKFIQLCSDRLFLVDAETSARLQAKVNKAPVYYYHFGYPGEENNNPNKTVGHAEDGHYFFFEMYSKEVTPSDVKMKDVMLEILLSFAKTGKPQVKKVTWTPTGHKELTYLNITGFKPEELVLKTSKDFSPREFWKKQGFLENQNLVLLKDHDEL